MMPAITFKIFHPKFIFEYCATVPLNKVKSASTQYILKKSNAPG